MRAGRHYEQRGAGSGGRTSRLAPVSARLVVLASGDRQHAAGGARRGRDRRALGARWSRSAPTGPAAWRWRGPRRRACRPSSCALADFPDRAAWDAGAGRARSAGWRAGPGGLRRLHADRRRRSVVRRFRIVNTHPRCCRTSPARTRSGTRWRRGADHRRDRALGRRRASTPARCSRSGRCDVLPGDDEDSLRERIQAVEKPLLRRDHPPAAEGAPHREEGLDPMTPR